MNFFSIKNVFLYVAIILFISLLGGIWIYNKSFVSNVTLDKEPVFIYISSNATYNDLIKEIEATNSLKNNNSFKWTAEKMKLHLYFKPGKYELINDMTNRELVNMIRIGEQIDVTYTLKSVRVKSQLASHISTFLEPDSTEFSSLLNNIEYIKTLGYDSNTVLSMFIPNTYYFKWNTSAKEFIERMKVENDKFWDAKKLNKASEIRMTKLEVSILASIVEKETSKVDEKATVAGVYMNRYRNGMRLQADPTLIFAIGDFGIRRVLNEHKEIDSPYNTYKYKGLPPGPICSPSISSINAVLNFEEHDYLYFCAKEDFSGYHNFAKSYSQHLNNARKFQRELDKRNIRS